MGQVIRVGKKRVIYIPKNVAEELGIREGDKMILEIVNGRMVLTPVRSFAGREFWGEVGVEEVEEVGEEITRRAVG